MSATDTEQKPPLETCANSHSPDAAPDADADADASARCAEPLANGGEKCKFSGVLNFTPAPVAPADALTATTLEAAVRLRTHVSGDGSADGGEYAPQTVHSLFVRTLERGADLPALVCKRDGIERRWTFGEYYAECVGAARALLALGLGARQTLAILGFNAPEWFFANIGTIFAGGVAVGIYATNSTDACRYIIEHARVQVLVVENAAQASKLETLPLAALGVRAVVHYSYSPAPPMPATIGGVRVLSWAELMAMGASVSDAELVRRLETQAPNHCGELIYTSGTTGNPKAVMISQDNLTWTCRVMSREHKFGFGLQRTVSYLPLSHIAAQMADIYVPLACATCVHFARPDALRGSLTETTSDARPTYFLGVPRVWEKFADRIEGSVRESSAIRQSIFAWARRQGLSTGFEASRTGQEMSAVGGWGYWLAKKLVFDKLKARLGLSEARICMTSAAPIGRHTLEFFLSLDIPILEIFGMSEITGPHNVSLRKGFRVGACGRPLGGTQSIIGEADENGEGEVLLDGRNIFMGYYKNPEETQATFDDQYRYRTGDLGKIDSDGYLFITGRIKELVITAGGENVAPVPNETRFKQALPTLVSNCMLIGDRRKFLSMLVTLRVDLDPVTLAPTDRLTSDARAALDKHCGLAVDSVSELISQLATDKDLRSKLDRLFQTALDAVNSQAVSNAARVQRCELLPRDFSVSGGELGPTMKLRRSAVARQYAALIDRIYADAEGEARPSNGAVHSGAD